MKITPIKGCAPFRFVRSLYYSNRPLPLYRNSKNENFKSKELTSIVNWLRHLFK